MVNLIGTMKGVLTSVAIMVLPAGSAFISGLDTNEYISAANGSPIIVRIVSNPRTLKSLVRNSTK
jgi:hypothetical protein